MAPIYFDIPEPFKNVHHITKSIGNATRNSLCKETFIARGHRC